MSDKDQTNTAGGHACSTDLLGPLPEPYHVHDAKHSDSFDCWMEEDMRAERQRCYELGLAVERERQQTVLGGYERIYNDAMRALRETVDERDKLRSYLARYRYEVPLWHQPHMMAHLVDDALGRA